MRASLHLTLMTILAAGCSDDSTARLDSHVGDSGFDVRQVEPDVAHTDEQSHWVPRDAGRDAMVMDGRVPDLAVDAEPDMRRPDTGVLRPDACVGAPPPEPQVSPDGSEVCNYVDDDGDGLVDEGYEYGLISDWIAVTDQPVFPLQPVLETDLATTAVAWTTNRGVTAILLGEDLCPFAPPILAPNFELGDGERARALRFHLSVNRGRLAVLAELLVGNGAELQSRLALQVLSSEGPVSPALLLDTEEEPAYFGLSNVANVGGGFGVITTTPNATSVMEIHPPDWRPTNRTLIAMPSQLTGLSRISATQDGFLILSSHEDPQARQVVTTVHRFDRSWQPSEGTELLGPGQIFTNLLPTWSAEEVLFPIQGFTHGPGPQQLWLARIGRDGTYAEGYPKLVHQHVSAEVVSLLSFASAAGQQVYSGRIRGGRQGLRTIRAVEDQKLEELEDPFHRLVFDSDPRRGLIGQSIARIERFGTGVNEYWTLVPIVARVGCPPENHN